MSSHAHISVIFAWQFIEGERSRNTLHLRKIERLTREFKIFRGFEKENSGFARSLTRFLWKMMPPFIIGWNERGNRKGMWERYFWRYPLTLMAKRIKLSTSGLISFRRLRALRSPEKRRAIANAFMTNASNKVDLDKNISPIMGQFQGQEWYHTSNCHYPAYRDKTKWETVPFFFNEAINFETKRNALIALTSVMIVQFLFRSIFVFLWCDDERALDSKIGSSNFSLEKKCSNFWCALNCLCAPVKAIRDWWTVTKFCARPKIWFWGRKKWRRSYRGVIFQSIVQNNV